MFVNRHRGDVLLYASNTKIHRRSSICLCHTRIIFKFIHRKFSTIRAMFANSRQIPGETYQQFKIFVFQIYLFVWSLIHNVFITCIYFNILHVSLNKLKVMHILNIISVVSIVEIVLLPIYRWSHILIRHSRKFKFINNTLRFAI